eukprot:jgi/Ulvmu1/1294/UM011_0018.1
MVAPGASSAEAVSATQKQSPPTQAPPPHAAADARPASLAAEVAPPPPGAPVDVKMRVNLPDAAVDQSTEPSPEDVKERFSKLRGRYPPSKEFSLYLDNLSLSLHCPPPLLMPIPYPPRPEAPPEYVLAAYSVHAPVKRKRPGPPTNHDAVTNSTSLRYRLMGKASADPRFHYVPPSRPISRVHSAAGMRSTPEPVGRSVAVRGTTAADLPLAGGASRMQVMQKTCAVCRRLHDVMRTATKARYCVQCEKLRWQLRAFGGKVHHLRVAYEEVGDPEDTHAILLAAKQLAQIEAVADEMPTAAAARHTAPLQARTTSGAASDSRAASAARSSADGGTYSGTDADMDASGARPAAAAGGEGAGRPEVDGSVAGDADAAVAPKGAPPAAAPEGEEDLDELAALLAGRPPTGGQEAEDMGGGDPMQRRAAMVHRPCDLCTDDFLTPAHSASLLCDTCGSLKRRAKQAGYTYTELQKGVVSGHIRPHTKPSVADIRRLLGDMFLGKAIKVPRERKERAPSHGPSSGTSTEPE